MKRQTRLSLSLREAVQRDFVALNNTVVVEGILIAPVLMMATTFKNALAAVTASIIIIFPAVVIDKLISRFMPSVLRWPVCVLISGLLTVPSYYVTAWLFPSAGTQIYLYGMLMMSDAVFIASFRERKTKGLFEKFQDVIFMLLGFALTALLTGIAREILGNGTLNGETLFRHAPVPFVNTLAGGMMLLAVFAAMMQAAKQAYLASRSPSGKEVSGI